MPYNRKAISGDYATETFYFPLSVQVEDEDSEDLYNVSSDSVRWFEDEIQEAIDDYQSDIEMEKYLCDDNDEIQRKLISAEWGVETLKGELYGCMKLPLKEPLTAEETEQMRNEVTGQASDGFGESFEQHPISLDGEESFKILLALEATAFEVCLPFFAIYVTSLSSEIALFLRLISFYSKAMVT